jgi:hypothetical protein
LDPLFFRVLIGLDAVALPGFWGVRDLEHAAINAEQASPLPALDFPIRTLQAIETFSDHIIQMLKEPRMQFLPRLTIGARGRYL